MSEDAHAILVVTKCVRVPSFFLVLRLDVPYFGYFLVNVRDCSSNSEEYARAFFILMLCLDAPYFESLSLSPNHCPFHRQRLRPAV